MAIELSTAGILVKWAVETTAGTRPTTGYAVIKGCKSLGEMNPEPETLEVTDLSDTEWKRYIPGLKDPGSAQPITVNDSAEFRTSWKALMDAYNGAKTSGKALWIEYFVPGLQSFFYAGVPSPLGFNGAEVNSVLESVAYITPNKVHGWDTSST